MKRFKIITLLILIILLTGCSLFEKNESSKKENKKDVTPSPTSTTSPKKENKKANDKYKIGDEVTVKGEDFYVFDIDGSSIELISKYCLTKDGKKQAKDTSFEDYKVEFSSTEYWVDIAKNYNNWDNKKFDLNTINGNGSGDVITKARDYATSLGATNGRLITYEEVEKLRDDYGNMIGGKGNNPVDTDDNYLNYYTSSVRPFNLYKVYSVRGEGRPSLEVDSQLYGVRPIITVNKSMINKK